VSGSLHAAPIQPPPATLSIPVGDLGSIIPRADVEFKSLIEHARTLKDQGKQLESFRALHDAVNVERGREREAYEDFALSDCFEGSSRKCIYYDGTLAVPLDPVPATLEELGEAFRDIDYWSGQLPLQQTPGVRYGWDRVTLEERERVRDWIDRAAAAEPFACDQETCLRLFAAFNFADADRPIANPVEAAFQWPLAKSTGLPIQARPTLALCRLTREGDQLGPPDQCVAVLASVDDQSYAVSVIARDISPAPPPPPPASGERGDELDPILRVAVEGVPENWLAKQIEQALSKPTLNLRAIARNAYTVVASSSFRDSSVLRPLREWVRFSLDVHRDHPNFFISVEQHTVRVTRQANVGDLRLARPDEIARYEDAMRNAIMKHLKTVCAKLPKNCEIS
jgi:hypothetical protein